MQPLNLWNINHFFDKVFTMDVKRLNDATPAEWTRAGVRATLDAREKTYGDYSDVSDTSQRIKNVLRQNPNWDELYQFQRESLDMIANKIARIVNGDKDYDDSWVDIAGYAQLVVDRLK